MNTNYQQLGTQIGALTDEKNAAYGSSFAKAGEFLALLYPNGLTRPQFDDALLLVRIFDKQMRVATNAGAFGESPYEDMAGYCLLGARMHHERNQARENDEPWPGSASDQDAAAQSKAAQPDSVDPTTRPPTPPIVNANAAPSASQLQERSCVTLESACASTATEPVSPSAEDRAISLGRQVLYLLSQHYWGLSLADLMGKTSTGSGVIELTSSDMILLGRAELAQLCDGKWFITQAGLEYLRLLGSVAR